MNLANNDERGYQDLFVIFLLLSRFFSVFLEISLIFKIASKIFQKPVDKIIS